MSDPLEPHINPDGKAYNGATIPLFVAVVFIVAFGIGVISSFF